MKRALVLKRCDGMCEGCGVVKATELHHTTYEHLYNEFLSELLRLCHSCHDRITREGRTEMGSQMMRNRTAKCGMKPILRVNDDDVSFDPAATYPYPRTSQPVTKTASSTVTDCYHLDGCSVGQGQFCPSAPRRSQTRTQPKDTSSLTS